MRFYQLILFLLILSLLLKQIIAYHQRMRFYQLMSFLLLKQVIARHQPSSQVQVNVSEQKIKQKAMTWRVLKNHDSSHKHYALFGSDELTNPYKGDTNIQESHALLCIKKLNLPLPSELPTPKTTPGGALRGSWSGARVAIIPKVKGTELTSLEVANELCRLEGLSVWKEDGFRMAEFHDGDQEAGWAGWDFWAEIPSSQDISNLRYWVWINDQILANPW